MDGPRHYAEAERILRSSEQAPSTAVAQTLLAQAQVHATLAHAAAAINAGNVIARSDNRDGQAHEVENSYAWMEILK